jgi:uncharacterized protein YbjT (DUF2867 family)
MVERAFMILVTSANGKVGRRVISKFVEMGMEIRAFDKSPNVSRLIDIGVTEAYVGDMNDNADCRSAMKGCDFVYYIGAAGIPNETEMGVKVIDIAKEQRINHFVLSSVLHPQQSSLLQHTTKLHIENHIINSGVSYTIIQPCHYHHNFNVEHILQTRLFSMFYRHDKKLSLVDVGDVAEVAGKIISEPQKHHRATYELVGSDYLTSDEMVEIFSQETGIPISSMAMSADDFIASLGDIPEYTQNVIRRLSKTYNGVGLSGNSNVLQWLLGRTPTTFREYVRREMKRISK